MRNAEQAKREEIENRKFRRICPTKKKMKKQELDRKRYLKIRVSDIKRRTIDKKVQKFRRLLLVKRWFKVLRLGSKKSKTDEISKPTTAINLNIPVEESVKLSALEYELLFGKGFEVESRESVSTNAGSNGKCLLFEQYRFA